MFDKPLHEVMDRNVLLTAPVRASVSDVAKLMERQNVGAVVIVDGQRPIGIFTERDAVFRVIAKGRDPLTTIMSDVMTPAPLVLGPESSYGHAMVLMQEHGFRHVPVVTDEQVIGMVTSRNALDPDLEEFVAEERRREHWRHDAPAGPGRC
ncbi:MAG TPA: CBS domain-containing protein [Usitatibacteraceae bacterium]|nr:CBS domain-containing protein [Usitatibacteraceae bacterium]